MRGDDILMVGKTDVSSLKEPRYVNIFRISDILSPPVKCGISTHHNIAKFADIAKTNPESLPIIKLGKTNDGKLYAINHHDVILGCKYAGPNTIYEIRGILTDNFTGSPDIQIAHFREITSNETFNTLAIYDTVDYLEERLQKTKKEILKQLWLEDTQYEKLIISKVDNFISSASIEKLQEIVNHLSDRRLTPTQITVPPYVLSKISRLQDENQQLMVISEIRADLESMSDGKFSWTTPEQIDTMIKFNRQESTHEDNNREQSVVATKTNTKDALQKSSKKNQNNNTNNDDESTSQLDQETRLIQKSIPNMIIIPDKKSGKPDLLVNKRMGAVSKIEKSDQKDILKTTSVGTKSLYSVPIEVTSHLDFNGDDDSDKEINFKIKYRNFDSVLDLEKFLRMFPKDNPVKLSLFWNVA